MRTYTDTFSLEEGDFALWGYFDAADESYPLCQSTTSAMSSLLLVLFYPACALRALGLLLADDAPTVGEGKTF